ncbi:3-dehydroquinate synthase [Desulfobulbus oligotrophicus]|jgi:3-dehydroquinate synthase|uniref:3-dehydroquinate synthase n=1 Tax=Desulfobulbus oligotrophicus TaxID=1909699 RepID=A0A7T6AQL5_9BACT|nr:3-dehydroquinate synthase [Desulfobulbus oligotrophicus]MDY0389441.1 3-dehydroquinate synthase [Desulfobulbus oligotrophicus]QQG65918.1 3-dehydroquinate synthase [Desulfobulbus oligotrophicus]
MVKQTIEVGLGERSYPIAIGPGVLSQIGGLLKTAGIAGRYGIISDDRVAALYGNTVLAALVENGVRADLFTFPHGEASKCLQTVEELAGRLAASGFDRTSGLIALGGGVVGDITGFLASIYMRGIPFVQIPTSLLAQVDSSVGGKTGVDLTQGKNLIGTFYQPRAVYIDTEVLQTLPEEEFLGGMAEVIKYGASIDADFFHWLREQRDAIVALDPAVIVPMIRRCCEMKAAVVEQDEQESGLRRILNFGHTIGHAVEAVSGYALNHGFAVAIGMRAVAELAVRSGRASSATAEQIEALLHLYGLPVAIPAQYDRAALRQFMRADKKASNGRLVFVLPVALGKVDITDRIDEAALDAVLA